MQPLVHERSANPGAQVLDNARSATSALLDERANRELFGTIVAPNWSVSSPSAQHKLGVRGTMHGVGASVTENTRLAALNLQVWRQKPFLVAPCAVSGISKGQSAAIYA